MIFYSAAWPFQPGRARTGVPGGGGEAEGGGGCDVEKGALPPYCHAGFPGKDPSRFCGETGGKTHNGFLSGRDYKWVKQ